ncbi:hypothetical protein [Sphingorhabdus sp. SMR4y]|uniref:hypothetical protein n=1 Tax=Sphingorhabdus sp. SMR4y TaxID=2584094 RepID=UPI000B5C63E0|nr:hypothetical protein [Sphingorhabdus sp. SMR4y]ASK88387.1 hypothetical protein SPHFLASMR4Y_01640 [Sphingorhabdus sp. SMR4y]
MLMDFQVEGGQTLAAEINAEMQDVSRRYRGPVHESRTFELPAVVWVMMFGSYAVFFTALFIATGRDAAAVFALLISIAYTIMYFAAAAVLNHVSASERQALPPAVSASGMETQTGWMDNMAIYAQILTVPIVLALFGCAFAVIRALV